MLCSGTTRYELEAVGAISYRQSSWDGSEQGAALNFHSAYFHDPQQDRHIQNDIHSVSSGQDVLVSSSFSRECACPDDVTT